MAALLVFVGQVGAFGEQQQRVRRPLLLQGCDVVTDMFLNCKHAPCQVSNGQHKVVRSTCGGGERTYLILRPHAAQEQESKHLAAPPKPWHFLQSPLEYYSQGPQQPPLAATEVQPQEHPVHACAVGRIEYHMSLQRRLQRFQQVALATHMRAYRWLEMTKLFTRS